MGYILKLYITGQTVNSVRAMENLKEICSGLAKDYELRIIDILKDPQLAEDDKIIATPTLVKELPPPLRKIIGDLSNTEKVLLGLDLVHKKEK
ncbi:MAG: circadian clock protein KaiB [Nitrospinota bacterium]|nr:circadian clock protein KaiB [Nitrospinota bacterium]MDH5679396.1 circadian clock protein KaiB [Nitrospinota bacterium]MDH5757058.1 circadian clock protein KaiB [Nitrospinota bacterium]